MSFFQDSLPIEVWFLIKPIGYNYWRVFIFEGLCLFYGTGTALNFDSLFVGLLSFGYSQFDILIKKYEEFDIEIHKDLKNNLSKEKLLIKECKFFKNFIIHHQLINE